mgnify:CR=1 FL=1
MKKRKSLAVNIITIFLLFNILSVVFFTFYVQKNGQTEAIRYARESSLEVIDEKSELISLAFEHIRNRTETIGMYTEDILNQKVNQKLSNEYVFTDDGTITRKKDPQKNSKQQSNIIVPNTSPLSEELIREINLTEKLDKYFEQVSETEDTTWCYIVTKENLLRCSPYSNLNDFFTSDHSQISDIFYTQAGDKNNPEHKAIWTAPYYDYLGTGWTMTCSQPVYEENGELFGVICLDMSVSKIKEKYFDGFSLGESGKVCWMSNEGQVYYYTDYENVTAEQGEIFAKNIFDTEMSPERESVLKDYVIKGGSGIRFFMEDEKQIMLVYSQVSNTDSVLFMQIEMTEFNALSEASARGLAVIIGIDLILTIIFSAILYCRFSKPMRGLTDRAERISNGDYSSINPEEKMTDGYYEIMQLNQAFEVMNESIEKYTESLIDKNREISSILEAIDEGLMIVDLDGNVNLRSKDSLNIPTVNLRCGIQAVAERKQSMSEKIVEGCEVYKNVYYPIMKDGEVCKIVVSSECITKTELMEKELQQIEKMAGVGQLSAAIVHELKNILALIKGAAYILDMTCTSGKEEIKRIQKAADEAENVIRTLLDFSGRDHSGSEMIHIGTVINQILLLSKKEIIRKGIHVSKKIDGECYVNSNNREAIKVILQNIILNAIQAVDFDGRIEICCCQEKGNVIVHIKDNGSGIKIEPKEKIFEPFMSTKKDGNGIGLWITKRLMDTLSGEISIAERNGETEFTLSIPSNREEAQK